MPVDGLVQTYALPELLAVLRLARSSYFYHRAPLLAADKYPGARRVIAVIFEINQSACGRMPSLRIPRPDPAIQTVATTMNDQWSTPIAVRTIVGRDGSHGCAMPGLFARCHAKDARPITQPAKVSYGGRKRTCSNPGTGGPRRLSNSWR
jgi:hypothetical protein